MPYLKLSGYLSPYLTLSKALHPVLSKYLTLIFKKLYELSRVLSTDLNLNKALNRCQSEIISIIFDWADLGDLQRPSGGKNRRFTMTSSRSSSSKNRLHLSERRGDDIPQICGKRKVRGGGGGAPLGNGKIRPKNDADTMKETRCVTAIMRGTSRSRRAVKRPPKGLIYLRATHRNAFFWKKKKRDRRSQWSASDVHT